MKLGPDLVGWYQGSSSSPPILWLDFVSGQIQVWDYKSERKDLETIDPLTVIPSTSSAPTFGTTRFDFGPQDLGPHSTAV